MPHDGDVTSIKMGMDGEERGRIGTLVAGHIAVDLAKGLDKVLPRDLVYTMVSDACKAAMAAYDAKES